MFQKQHLLFLVAVSFIAFKMQAQTVSPNVLAVGGNFVQAGGYSLSQTVGEMTMVQTVSASSYILTQGFQQPELKKVTSISDLGNFGGALELFPNPASDFVHLQYKFSMAGTMQMMIYNSIGQRVSANYTDEYDVGEKTFTIYTADLAAGVYYVNALFSAKNGKQYSFDKKLEVIR